jgi:hypothetical protein
MASIRGVELRARDEKVMTSKSQKSIETRTIQAAETALYQRQYVSAMDVLMGMGVLQLSRVEDWKKGKLPYLERAISGSLGKITRIMKTFRQWAIRKELNPRETIYYVRTRGPKKALQFSKSGDPGFERAYRTHYVSSALSEKKQRQLLAKQSQAPDIVYSIIRDSRCSKCKAEILKGNLLLMEAENPLCLMCAHLNHLVFLPSGDASITRRLRKMSSLSAVVVKFSRARNRYERQGILIEKEAFELANCEKSQSG